MWKLGLILAALGSYLAILGCALHTSADGPAATTGRMTPRYAPASYPTTLPEGLPYRSVTMQIQRTDWIDRYKKGVDEIAALGADAVKFVVDARQENGSSSAIYLDLRMTPSAEALGELIRYARGKKLRVILMPIVLLDKPRGNEWRGRISPESWPDWWSSYRGMLGHFSWIAEGAGADVLVVGSELVSTEDKLDEWTRTIAEVRKTFKGKLTYSANWDHYQRIPFWDQLDLVSMNSYWKLGPDRNVTIPQIKQNWQKIQDELFAFHLRSGKPILFSEVGWCSMTNAAHEPWDYTTGDDIDLELQRKLYEAFFESWWGKSWFAGFSVWEWTPDAGGPKDRGYTPKDKPAEAVLRQWLAKPWTDGNP